MNFWRQQQILMAERLLRWQYQKKALSLPDEGELRRQSQILVADAHRIAQRTGRNVLAIVKELIQDFKKKDSA